MKSEKVRKPLVLAAVIAALSIAAISASAQTTRVQFKRGATSTYLTGTLSSYKQKRVFLVHVRKGQTMKIRDVGNNAVSIWVEGPPHSGYEQDLAADCHGMTDVSPTAAGDYKLTVQECQKVDRWRGKFRVKVTVR